MNLEPAMMCRSLLFRNGLVMASHVLRCSVSLSRLSRGCEKRQKRSGRRDVTAVSIISGMRGKARRSQSAKSRERHTENQHHTQTKDTSENEKRKQKHQPKEKSDKQRHKQNRNRRSTSKSTRQNPTPITPSAKDLSELMWLYDSTTHKWYGYSTLLRTAA